VDWHEGLPRDAIAELLGRSRYGLNCMQAEHFGIAIAELLTAGCVTLVHDSGGAPEIQDDPGLRYREADEAARLLVRVIGAPDDGQRLHHASRARGLRFSPTRFVASLRPLLDAVDGGESRAVPRFTA
jgi:glycosyltransferase involved in cell wall biosynthesis